MSGGAAGPIRPGRRGISEALRTFVEEIPFERLPILAFVQEVAAKTPPGARVLDLGAGDAPYRELFRHADYRTHDWPESPHVGGALADVVAHAAALPLERESLQLILCTQVLEHVPEPARVLSECFRILEPGGELALTVPLVWELHELPHDYYRYTERGVEHLLTEAGFVDIAVAPRNDSFTTLAQLLLNARHAMGRAPDGLDPRREDARELLSDLASQLARLAPLAVRWQLPLGYRATARRP